MRNISTSSCISTLGPQLAVLFGEMMEYLGDAAMLEEVCPWEWAQKVYNLTLLPLSFLSFLCVELSALAIMLCLPHRYEPSLLDSCFWSWCFITDQKSNQCLVGHHIHRRDGRQKHLELPDSHPCVLCPRWEKYFESGSSSITMAIGSWH